MVLHLLRDGMSQWFSCDSSTIHQEWLLTLETINQGNIDLVVDDNMGCKVYKRNDDSGYEPDKNGTYGLTKKKRTIWNEN